MSVVEENFRRDFYRDLDNSLCFGPRKYIDKITDAKEDTFKQKPTKYSSPMEKNAHPEFDDSKLLDADGVKNYQAMTGTCQCAVLLGRFNIQTEVMTMSQIRVAPRLGHLSRLQHIYGYLKK